MGKIAKIFKVVEISEGQIRQMTGERQEYVCSVQKKKNRNFCPGKSQNKFREGSRFNKGSLERNKKEQALSSNKKCFRCDREGHMAKSETCPARDKMCRSCGKVRHFAIVCKTKTRVSAVRTDAQLAEISRLKDSSSSSEEDVWQLGSVGKHINMT